MSPDGRYHDAEILVHEDPSGRKIRYHAIRLVPAPDKPIQALHLVQEGERLDHIAHRHYRDPQAFWWLCDANGAMWPNDLVAQPGRRILVPHRSDSP